MKDDIKGKQGFPGVLQCCKECGKRRCAYKCGLELVYNDGIEYNQTNGAQVVVTDAGTATMIITGIGNYQGTLAKRSFTVYRNN